MGGKNRDPVTKSSGDLLGYYLPDFIADEIEGDTHS